ncbi:MAG: Gfo/Idh/MocA family oxidoreductase [Eubacteriales bacterium]
MKKINVGIVGLGFGKEFVGIYQNHPFVDQVAVCTRNADNLRVIGDEFKVPESLRYTDYKLMLKNADLDAIHVVTPILEHYEQSLAALQSGKHTACTVPMATSIEELKTLVDAKMKSGKIYMMMETAVYTREFLFAKNLYNSGKLGRLQFLRGSHMQDMGLEGWPAYWLGFPPMHYGTHAISPLLRIDDSMTEYVAGHGSGSISAELAEKYNSPFAVETVTIKRRDSNVTAEATRSLYETVRQYRESFDVYGSSMSIEWEQIADEGLCLFEGGESARREIAPDAYEDLPREILPYTKREQILDKNHVSFIQGAGHGGSHPHLVNEFVSAIAEERDCALSAEVSANITATGILGHQSCLEGGTKLFIPEFK